MVDVRKYAAGTYLKPADVEEAGGTMTKQIINAEESEGKFGAKLDLWFLDGSKISLSGKNVGELMRVYGTDSDDWLEKTVELHVKEYEDRDGKAGKMIVLTAIDDPIPPEQRTPITSSVEPATKPKPAPKESPKREMDDEIPF